MSYARGRGVMLDEHRIDMRGGYFEPQRDTRMKPSTVLVIEDDAAVRLLLVQALTDAGYQVSEAVDGRQGLAQFRAQPTDLVLTDLEMPTMNGLDLISELTRTYRQVKVMAMSGGPSEGLQMARFLGARQTLTKPLELPVLLRSVQYELAH